MNMSDEQFYNPNAMTVRMLRRYLESFDDDTQVFIAYNSGDYWGRTIAKPLGMGLVEEVEVEWSEYHDTYAPVIDGDKPNGPHFEAVVLGI
jgi:hypothetical protein